MRDQVFVLAPANPSSGGAEKSPDNPRDIRHDGEDWSRNEASGLLGVQIRMPLNDCPRSRSALSRIKNEKPLRLRGLRCSGTQPEDLDVTNY